MRQIKILRMKFKLKALSWIFFSKRYAIFHIRKYMLHTFISCFANKMFMEVTDCTIAQKYRKRV